MFKCSECQKEYEIKPDFCECGNDTFDEVSAGYTKNYEADIQLKPTIKELFEARYPMLTRFKHSLDPISVIIFMLCMVLSVLSLIFVGFKPVDSEESVAKSVVSKNINVADIEDIWDNTPPKNLESTINTEKISVIQPETPVVKDVLNKNIQNQTKNTKISPKSVAVSEKKTNKSSSTPKNQQKSQTSTSKTTVNTAKNGQNQTTNNKNQTQNTPKTTQNTQTSTNTKTSSTSSSINLKPKVQQVNQADLQELKTYKSGLRNLLFSKIDFTQISGDGVCVITFKISDNGKLTDKKFAQLSQSESLNDAVFYSVNTTMSYKSPPTAYNGEVLKFTVKFSGGQYLVSLN